MNDYKDIKVCEAKYIQHKTEIKLPLPSTGDAILNLPLDDTERLFDPLEIGNTCKYSVGVSLWTEGSFALGPLHTITFY